MHESWRVALADQRGLLEGIEAQLARMQAQGIEIAPPLPKAMRALTQPLDTVRVLIVGQDPYPTAGHACGLSFAVERGVKPLPKSQQNIMRELSSDLPGASASGDMARWQDQGVLLLNRHLTTSVGQAGAHGHLGWAAFTDAVIRALIARPGGTLVAVLWGAHAQQLKPQLGSSTVIESPHPSPLSSYRGFFGSRPFSRANQALKAAGLPEIDWSC
ncbi:MAG: uracil-DNA glycosylase [Phenylobacterium zucineum]|nr:MAG: uracil-DNA glycosylase [Phenylobacterium zucineum]